jgi:hypothetical protein
VITSRGLTSLVGPFLYVLALGAIAVAARGQSTAGQRPVLAASAPSLSRHPAAGNAPSCPLSPADQVKSVKAFAEMMPVFRHPRCSNCHGGVDPFSDAHRGADQVDPKKGREQCQDCHDQLQGWDTPGAPMFFVGRSNEKICLQIKQFSSSGEDFVEHIRHDHGGIQFIAAGFNGDRALDAQLLKDYDLVVEKPPGTQEQLTAKAQKWVAAMGGDFVGSPECGCLKPRIELKMTSEWTATMEGKRINHGVSVAVPIEPDTSGFVFTGSAPLSHEKYSMSTPPGCRLQANPAGGELAVTEARFDVAADERMTISLAVAPTMDQGTWRLICPRLPPIAQMVFDQPIFSWMAHWAYLHQPDRIGNEFHFDEFESASGLALSGDRKLVGHKEVSRSKTIEGLTMTTKTTFEFWWVGLETPAN